MKRPIYMVVVVCLMSLMLVSSAFAKVEIEWWDPYGPPWGDNFTIMVNEFMKANPEIQVDRKIVPWDGFFEKLAVGVASGTAPAAAHIWRASNAVVLWNRGLLTPVTQFVKEDPEWDAEDIMAISLENFLYEGEMIALPDYVYSPQVLFWNKDLFRDVGLDPEKSPKTLEEALELSDKMYKLDAIGNVETLGFVPYQMWGGAIQFALLFGGNMYDAEKRKVTASDPKVIESIKWMKNLFDKYGGWELMSGFQLSLGKGFGNYGYVKGKVGIQLWDANFITVVPGYNPDMDWGMALPVFPGGWSPGEGLMANMNTHILLKSEHPEAGYELIKWMSFGWGAKFIAEKGPLSTSSKKLNASIKVPDYYGEENWEIVQQTLALYMRQRPMIPIYNKFQSEFTAQVELAWRGEKTAEQAMEYVDKAIQKELDRFFSAR